MTKIEKRDTQRLILVSYYGEWTGNNLNDHVFLTGFSRFLS